MPDRSTDIEISTCLELVGESKNVLFIGDARQEFLAALGAQGASVEHFPIRAWAAPREASSLPGDWATRSFDVVILDHVLEQFQEPHALLDALRKALRHGGFVVAVLPNSGGAVPQFASAGFTVAQVEVVRRADSDAYDFVIKAAPATYDAAKMGELPSAIDALERRVEAMLESELAVRSELIAALTVARAALHRAQDDCSTISVEVDELRAEKTVLSRDLRDVLNRLYERNGDVEERRSTGERLAAELEAVRGAAASERLVMREYIETLRGQVAEISMLRQAHRQLIAQSEGLISALREESTQIVTLIDTTQASHFWKLKYWLNRLKARIVRR